MNRNRQAWLAAVGTAQDPLPDDWVEQRPNLLREWPLLGGRYQPGIKDGDHLLYHAAGHKKLLGVARAKGSAADADRSLSVQMYVAIPLLRFAPPWEILDVKPERLQGHRAITLEDEEYERGLQALVSIAAQRFKG